MTARIAANASQIGKLHQTPHIGARLRLWNTFGIININGIKNITWRVKLKKIALYACPMEV
jgi:hypothetical protein